MDPPGHLTRLKVTGFTSPRATLLIHAGFLGWIALLVVADLVHLFADTGESTNSRILHGTVVGANVALFALYAWNAFALHHRNWVALAGYYALQLTALNLLGASVGNAVGTDPPGRFVSKVLRAVGQCCFTAAQLALTFEYLHRYTFRPEAWSTRGPLRSAPQTRAV